MLQLRFILEFLALIIGALSWQKMYPVYLRMIVLVLLITFINEYVIIQQIEQNYSYISRDIAYNIFSVIDISIWIYVFYKIYLYKRMNRHLFIPATIAFLYSIIDIFFIYGIRHFHTNSMMLYNLSIILLSGNYLFYSLKKEYYQPLSDSLFWICAACIGYHSLLFLNFVTIRLPEAYWQELQANKVWVIVSLSANIFYYLLLSIAFLTCFKKGFRQTSSQ